MQSLSALELYEAILNDAAVSEPIRFRVVEANRIIAPNRYRAEIIQSAIVSFVMLMLLIAGIGIAFVATYQ